MIIFGSIFIVLPIVILIRLATSTVANDIVATRNLISASISLFSLGVSLLICGLYKKKSKLKLDGYCLAIFSICFSIIIPIVSFICGGIAIKKAKEQINNSPTTPKTVLTISKISFIISIIALIVLLIINN